MYVCILSEIPVVDCVWKKLILAVTRPGSWYTRLTRGRVVVQSLNARCAVVLTRDTAAVQ